MVTEFWPVSTKKHEDVDEEKEAVGWDANAYLGNSDIGFTVW